MPIKRLLSFLFAAFLIVKGMSGVYKGYQQQRLGTYLTSASSIHKKVQASFEKFGKKNDEMKKQLDSGNVDPNLFEECEAGLANAAKVSREQKAKLAKLTPPSSATKIHAETLDFFENRAKFAEDAIPFYQTCAEYTALEKEIGDHKPTPEQQAKAKHYDAEIERLTASMQEQGSALAKQDASLAEQVQALSKE